ncbi:MAG: DUF2225 domain-containing protein [Oscillospiraceae bacterium]|nr:DUF2225 domain-containing protein [Oscillospiraceae bacterium]
MDNLNIYRNAGTYKIFKKGEVVFTQWEEGEEMYVVLKGEFTAQIKTPGNDATKTVVYKPGDYFGELSLLDHRPRSATIVCSEGGTAVGVNRENFPKLLECAPSLSARLFNALHERCTALEKVAKGVMRGKEYELIELSPRSEYGTKPQNPYLDMIHMGLLAERIRGTTDFLGGHETDALARLKIRDSVPLFPKAHGSYDGTLKLAHMTDTSPLLSFIKTKCPLCKVEFEEPFLMQSKVRRTSVDPDMRARYAEIEPMHYAVITCPNCLFSADGKRFAEARPKYADEIFRMLDVYKPLAVKSGKERDSFTVFAGYYLSLLCASIVYDKHEFINAETWLRLSRLYDDCGDKAMLTYAQEQAYEGYNYIYSKIRLDEKQTQQITFTLAELCFKLGKTDAAGRLFFELKQEKMIALPAAMLIAVENRIEAIREMKAAARGGT